MIIQKAGLHVVAVAGSSKDLAKSYGADEIIDYRNKSDSELAKEIKAAAGGKIRYVYDVVSEGNTLDVIAEAFKDQEDVKYTYTLHWSDEQLNNLPKNISTIRTMVGSAHDGDADFAKKWFTRLGEWLDKDEFKAMKVTVIPGGLNGVEEGLKRLQNNEVKGEKLVYRISETKDL